MKKRIKYPKKITYPKKRTHKEAFPNEKLPEFFIIGKKKPYCKEKNDKEIEIFIKSKKEKKISSYKDNKNILEEEQKK